MNGGHPLSFLSGVPRSRPCPPYALVLMQLLDKLEIMFYNNDLSSSHLNISPLLPHRLNIANIKIDFNGINA